MFGLIELAVLSTMIYANGTLNISSLFDTKSSTNSYGATNFAFDCEVNLVNEKDFTI